MIQKFSVILTNPPFNSADKTKGRAGTTGGDQILFRRFIDKAFQLRKDDGVVAYIITRSGINYTFDKYNVTKYNVDTSEHWHYAAGWFISNGQNNDAINVSHDPIIRKVHTIDRLHAHNIASGYQAYLEQGKYSDRALPDTTYGIVETPTKENPKIKMGHIVGTVVPAGPKLFYKQLETRNSYTATTKPHFVGCTHTLFYDTLDQAKAARLFILNNPIIPYLNKRLNEKTNGHVFRALKPFDLGQIITGKEYPKEWNLTQQEIERVEANQGRD